MPIQKTKKQIAIHYFIACFGIAVGSFLAALSIQVFLVPNQLIDGGIVGIALILSRLYQSEYLPYFLIFLNIPFVYLAYRYIRRTFVIHMLIALLFFAFSLYLLKGIGTFHGEALEVIVFGGAILGIGAGLIIRYGGCTDGTEIMAILINRKKGFTVGQVVLVMNIFIFGAYGWIFHDWHIALQSLMMYVIAAKMIDIVFVGFDELKSVMIISSQPKQLSEAIITELGLGLTIIHGKGGFSGESKDIIFVIIERLDLSDLKDLVLKEDPSAFMAIENLHEVVYGHHSYIPHKKKGLSKLMKSPH